MYVVISTGPDGLTVDAIAKDVLLTRLTEEYWGTGVRVAANSGDFDPESAIPCLLVIRGDVVVPKVTETAIRYDI